MHLGLLQLSDSALPISGYTHSWGLEAAIAQGRVHDPETLEQWTETWLRTSLGPFEGVLVANACRFAHQGSLKELFALNELAEASIVPPSVRTASREMGDQLVTLGCTWSWCGKRLQDIRRQVSPDSPGWHHPVAFGLLGHLSGAAPEEVLTAYLHQAVLGMIGAGVRAIPVGHTHGQQVVAYLHEGIQKLVPDLTERAPETSGAGCPFYEILCDEQTQLYARMFRS